MEIRLTIDGIEATFQVRDAAEAVALVRELAAVQGTQRTTTHTTTTTTCPPTDPICSMSEPPTELVESEPQPVEVDSVTLRKALNRLRGNNAAKLLEALVAHPDGCTDVKLKKLLAIDQEENLGPLISNISKQCKRFNFARDAVLSSQHKRLPGGVVRYRYRITEPAAEIIRSIPGYGEVQEFHFDDDEDDAMT